MHIVRSFHKLHDNAVIRATYAHILPNEKYRVIIVLKPKISCNIVWTQKKDIIQGWSGQHYLSVAQPRGTSLGERES